MNASTNLDLRLIASALRTRLAAFEAGVAALRAMADDSMRTADERIGELARMAGEFPDGQEHARQLVQGLTKEITARRFRRWSELVAWCAYAAAPRARYVLELHHEAEAARIPLEALYSSVRLLECVAGCGEDYRIHDRIYIPGDWLGKCGASEDSLANTSATPELREALGRMLDGIDRLMPVARAAPLAIHDRRLRRAVRVALAGAERLAAKLRRRDPLAGPVTLGWVDRRLAELRGQLTEAVTRSSGPAVAGT